MIVAGIGCRRGAPASDIEAAIRAALSRAGLRDEVLDAVATIATKSSEGGIAAAAAMFGVAVLPVEENALKAASARAETHSERVLALVGVASVAEAAALAAAGPQAQLICPRIVVGTATCAIAASAQATRPAS